MSLLQYECHGWDDNPKQVQTCTDTLLTFLEMQPPDWLLLQHITDNSLKQIVSTYYVQKQRVR